MNDSNTKIHKEACAWIAKLHDQPASERVRDELKAWMAQSQEHESELRRLAQLWGELNVLNQLATPAVKRPWHAVYGLARWQLGTFAVTALFFVFVGFFIAFHRAPDELPQQYQTAVGEQRTVTLADGSTVILNTNSLFSVDISQGARHIFLHQGEAMFDVAHDKKRPFLVHTANGVVRAVGTAFSVNILSDILEVTVAEGRVAISVVDEDTTTTTITRAIAPILDPDSTIADAGQRVTISKQAKSVESIDHMAPVDLSKALSWREGLLKFTGDPLADVVAEMSRYTSLSIVIVDSELRSLRIGGFFKVGDVDRLLEALEAGFNVHAEYVSESEIHLSRAG